MTTRSDRLSSAPESEAAAWVLRLQEPDLSEAATREWLAWCEADPRNREAFDRMAELWDVASTLDRKDFDEPGVSSTGLYEHAGAATWWPWALAAAFVLLLGSTWLLRDAPKEGRTSTARLETPTGKVQAARLEDGSTIELGGSSSFSVRYTRETRTVVAGNGEAFFEVAKDKERPFVVEAGPLKVVAIGTAFSVQREGESVSVLVTEGMVQVEAKPDKASNSTAVRLSAGQRLRFDQGELTQLLERTEGSVVAPWREGRLEFRDEPLRLVVARINRYSEEKLEIKDASIADLKVTSTVYHDRLEAWLSGIEAVLPVRISREGEKIVIAPALPAKGPVTS